MDAPVPPPVQIVETELPCSRCGYSLRGLAVDGRCPECAWPVEASLRGGLLRYAGPEYLSSLATGAFIIVVTNIAAVVFGVLAFVLVIVFAATFAVVPPATPGTAAPAAGVPAFGWIESVGTIGGALITIASLVGYWLFTIPDPATNQTEQPRAARRVVRAAVIATIFTQVGLIATMVLGPQLVPVNPANPMAGAIGLQLASGALNVAGLLAGAVLFFAMMLYVRWLAQRIPDGEMVARTRLYMWLLPVLYTVGALCVGIGPLVAMVLYLILVWNLRRQVLAAREQAAHLSAA